MYYFLAILMILITSVMLIFPTHPILMLMSIMLLTLFMSMTFYFFTQFSLVSLVMILLILGGMLIIFMYMVSLTPNSKISLNWKMLLILPVFLFLFKWNLYFENMSNKLLNKIYFLSFVNLILLMMIYLILTLTVVMKLTNSNMIPMKMT
uniref:NADH dehydrogenase subunit 6 n=1 Tax=Haemaphysalis sulcata TaxID=490559 RepID=UPI001FAF1301|nr:NADH dehydrogenase subunit 6 [Haemaphysalis sulcata]UNO53934.1 NADH dehydrogenase subunit 6 [Haemaphysalis sulcata]